jgi:hypothetical protein
MKPRRVDGLTEAQAVHTNALSELKSAERRPRFNSRRNNRGLPPAHKTKNPEAMKTLGSSLPVLFFPRSSS